jgi:hypothetical protein
MLQAYHLNRRASTSWQSLLRLHLANPVSIVYTGGMKIPHPPTPVVRLGVDEGNHAEMPAIMAGGHRAGQHTRVIEKEVLRNGEVVKQVWKVMGNAEYGLPSGIDADVYYALMELSDEQRWPRKVHFSLYDLIERMGWSHGGESYANARESLKRWATVRIEATNSFYVLQNREYRGTLVWGFIEEAYVPQRDEVSDRGSPVNYIVWNEHLHQSVLSGYVLAIDLDLYRRLRKRPLARRLYTFLNKKFGAKRAWAMELKSLAHTHLGIAESRSSPAQIRAMLDPAVELLKENGYLRGCQYRARSKETIVTFHRAGSVAANDEHAALSSEEPPLAQLRRRLFGSPGSTFREADVATAQAFIDAHGAAAWSEFIDFADEYRRSQWPDMKAVGGALTLLERFLESRAERQQASTTKHEQELRRQWQHYLDANIESTKREESERFAAFEAVMSDHREYQRWLEASHGKHFPYSTDESRQLHADTARELYRDHFLKAFADRDIKSYENWLATNSAA